MAYDDEPCEKYEPSSMQEFMLDRPDPTLAYI